MYGTLDSHVAGDRGYFVREWLGAAQCPKLTNLCKMVGDTRQRRQHYPYE